MSCGELGPIEGGLIKNSTIQNSTITGSEFTGGEVRASDLVSCNLKNTASCDAASARTIADAIAGDETASGAIAEAIAGQNPASFANPAAAVAAPELPTYMYGSRDAVLGKPAAWMQVGDYVIPVYAKAGA